MSSTLKWIDANRPAAIQDLGDRLELVHASGESSTLWKRLADVSTPELQQVLDCFTAYDGIDLFSSTFKLASSMQVRMRDSVQLTFTLRELHAETIEAHCVFPPNTLPFMYQAGIGYYAIHAKSYKIYEWDVETRSLTAEYSSVEEILNEWLAAVM